MPFFLSIMRSLIRVSKSNIIRFILDGNFAYNIKDFQHLNRYDKQCVSPFSQKFSTISVKRDKLGVKEPARLVLLGKLERALKDHQVDEAWEVYKDFKQLYGFPDQNLMANLIADLSYSSESKLLRRACDLVISISKEKTCLLKPDMMTKLALSLARAQISVSTASILRLMLEKKSLPLLDVLRVIFLHLVKTDIGTYLASNILIEICESCRMLNTCRSSKKEFTMPDATVFNLVLDACVKFGLPLKGQQIIELMARVGVTGDAHTVVVIACIHEKNGMRDELKKFKGYVDSVPVTLAGHYRQFYECLLNLHFKFNDLDSVSGLLLDICGLCKSKPSQSGQRELQELCNVSIGSDHIKMGMKLQFLPEKLQKDYVYKLESKQELLMYKNGKLVLTNKCLVKLILEHKKHNRINELSKLLIRIHNILKENNTPCSDVIDACIHLGWLEIAHDIIEDLESEKYYVSESSYATLLTAYYDKKMTKEAEALVRHVRRAGLDLTFSDEHMKELASTCESDLGESIARYMREEDKVVSPLLLEYNSSIYFFTKAKMIEDALMTYRKMQQMKIRPNLSTFFHMISGYSSLGMYREITILWGDIKRRLVNPNRDLYELLLLNFIRGGYFERVMEVIGLMTENGMYMDKWCYKNEFLKLHRDLYRRLTELDAKNEAQIKRIGYVKAFRKLVGIS